MHITESVVENGTHKILNDFDIQKDHLISAKRLNQLIVNKKEILPNYGLGCPCRPHSKIKIKQKEISRPCLRPDEAMEHEGDGVTICSWCNWNDSQRIGKGTGRHRNQRASGNHTDYSITNIGQNTEKCPGDLIRLAVTQILARNHQLTFVWKTLKLLDNNICFDIILFHEK